MSLMLQLEICIRLLVALILGWFIGREREFQNKPAGIRTHSLVCLTSALFMVISIYGFQEFTDGAIIRKDPARLAAQAVSGVAFIGAGVIWKEGFNVKGLTTAASLWLVCGAGLATGAGLYIPALVSTFLAYIALEPLKIRRFFKGDPKAVTSDYLNINFIELKAAIEDILDIPIKYEVIFNNTSTVIVFETLKKYRDSFYFGISLKEDVLQILSLRIPEYIQNKGIGSALVKELKDWAEANEYSKINVVSRVNANNFWQKNGFKRISEKTFVYDLKK